MIFKNSLLQNLHPWRSILLYLEVFTNESFNHNKDLSCLRGVNEFRLDIQTTDTSIGKLWIEFKGMQPES